MALMAGPTLADTLRQALASTYASNPTITAQREALRGTDANVAIARSAGRPQLTANVGLNRDLSRSGILKPGGDGTDLSAGVDLSYPLFNGGRVKNNVRAAEARVEAGRATLRAVEGDVLTEAVAAYMDVIRDRAVFELTMNNVRVLGTTVEAVRLGFTSGDLTRTDIAQSEARLQLGRAGLATAQGRLTGSEENYRRVVGKQPGGLTPPPPLPPLPAKADEAALIALSNNPDLIAIKREASAAGFDVRVARAGRLPTISTGLSGTYVDALGRNEGGHSSTGSQATAGFNGRVPLYQGGLPSARTRAAQALEGQLLEQTIATERAVVSATRSAFANYRAAQNAIASNQVAVTANELALEGAHAERSVGTRTVLDVLNAEQELLDSQVSLVTARRDAYVAGFQLLNAMGQAEADALGLEGGPLYDPLGNYRRVANNWSDWAGDARHVPIATRTEAVERMASFSVSQRVKKSPGASEQRQNGIVRPSVAATESKLADSTAGASQSPTGSATETVNGGRALVNGRGWRLQLGAFSTEAAAEALYQKLVSEKLLTAQRPFYVAAGKLTRLQIGHFTRRLDATTACGKLESRGQPCFAVTVK
jgi:outer membrane protein